MTKLKRVVLWLRWILSIGMIVASLCFLAYVLGYNHGEVFRLYGGGAVIYLFTSIAGCALGIELNPSFDEEGYEQPATHRFPWKKAG